MSLLGKRDNNDNNISNQPLKKIKLSNNNVKTITSIDHLFTSYLHNSNMHCGNLCTIFIDDNNNIYSFGYNEDYKLGHDIINNKYQISYPLQIQSLRVLSIQQISCGFKHTVCLDNNGSVYTFGDNTYGQLGINKNLLTKSFEPQKVNICQIDQISCGFYFTICLSYESELWSFGNSIYGELGTGNRNTFLPNRIKESLEKVEYFTCGGYHCFFKSFSGIIYSWGSNNYNQLGKLTNISYNIPTKSNIDYLNIISIKCGINHSLFLLDNGHVYSCGNNEYGQTGLERCIKHNFYKIQGLPFIKYIECGYLHSMCIDINNNLWVFGSNQYGQLGLDLSYKFTSKPIKHENIKNIIGLSHGGFHTFIKTINNNIYTFGRNDKSQLGLKQSNKQSKPIQVFKDKKFWKLNSKSKQKSALK